MNVGANIKEIRQSCRVSVQEVATALCVTDHTVYAWESGKIKLSFKRALQLADLYNATLDEIVGRE